MEIAIAMATSMPTTEAMAMAMAMETTITMRIHNGHIIVGHVGSPMILPTLE